MFDLGPTGGRNCTGTANLVKGLLAAISITDRWIAVGHALVDQLALFRLAHELGTRTIEWCF